LVLFLQRPMHLCFLTRWCSYIFAYLCRWYNCHKFITIGCRNTSSWHVCTFSLKDLGSLHYFIGNKVRVIYNGIMMS
jgi:hypothetical protein